MVKFPRLLSLALAALLFASPALAQSTKQRIEAYINQYKELAIAEMLRTGVPASVTLAQGILETSGGQSSLASVANNHFGIKCKSDWTGESVLHDDDARNECFRKYSSAEESYKDHSDFLKSRPHYAFLFKLDPTDYEGWAKGLKKAGYATSSTYSQALIRLIVENNLQDYTLLAMQRTNGGDELFASATPAVDSEEEADAPEVVVATEDKQAGMATVAVKEVKEKKSQGKYPVNAVFNINESKVIYALAGTSLLAVANNYNVSFKKLLEFNDLDPTDILNDDQLIFLQKKPKKGNTEIHIVEENESLHEIAQKEGIQLSTIMEFNNLQKGMQPATGEKIYLKYPAPNAPRLAASGAHKTATDM